VLARYPKAAVGDFDGQPDRLTEMDALVAYLQILGRMVDFTSIRSEDLLQ
jgi:cytochrome c oxidase cbb3-type subunit 2